MRAGIGLAITACLLGQVHNLNSNNNENAQTLLLFPREDKGVEAKCPLEALKIADPRKIWSDVSADGSSILLGYIPDSLPHPQGKFTLLVLPDSALGHRSAAMAAALVNDTDKTQGLATHWHTFSPREEVSQPTKSWVPIERFSANPSQELCGVLAPGEEGWLELPPRSCLVFEIRRYQGTRKMKMRLVIPAALSTSMVDLVSNEFEGSINPGQLLANSN